MVRQAARSLNVTSEAYAWQTPTRLSENLRLPTLQVYILHYHMKACTCLPANSLIKEYRCLQNVHFTAGRLGFSGGLMSSSS